MKKMIVCTYGMTSGGVETSLINFLKHYSKREDLEITLLLLKNFGKNLYKVPDNVKVITIPFKKSYYNIYDVFSNVKGFINKTLYIFYKVINKFFLLRNKIQKSYNFFLTKTNKLDDYYDLAIDFHGYGYFGTGYVSKIINAKSKAMFVHSSNLEWTDNVEEFLDLFDKIYCVSDTSRKLFNKKYDKLKTKTSVFHNIIDENNIKNMSTAFSTQFDKENFNILTVGRLEKEKGYHIIIQTAKILKDSNLKFKWYIIGIGSLENFIKQKIMELGLSSNVIMLGEQDNPYPYFKECDLYVQSSIIEGYGLTIAEAKCLNKLIVCSNIPTFKEQIENGVNGYICELSAEDFANKIIYIEKNYNYVLNKISVVTDNAKNIEEEII